MRCVLVLVASFIFTLTRGQRRSWLLSVAHRHADFVLHGTAPAVFAEPRYPWVYKHFGVVEYIVAHGSVNGQIDIYHNWPGFFAGAAWLERWASASESFAGWSQVFFNLTYFLELSFIYQALISGTAFAGWLYLFSSVRTGLVRTTFRRRPSH